MSLKVSREEASVVAVLRFTNGPLQGCEYGLETGKTLFVVGAVEDLIVSDVIPELPKNTVVVPMPRGGINYEVIISSDASESFSLRVLTDAPENKLHLYQASCNAGDIRFSIRRANEDWRLSTNEYPAPRAIKAVKKLSPQGFRIWLLGLGALFSLAIVSIVILRTAEDDGLRTRVSAAISGSIGKYQVVKGRDDFVYVFADSGRDMAWGRQALIRAALDNKVKISSLRLEESRIVDLLQTTYPTLAFHRVKLKEISKPVLMLSRDRTILTEEGRRGLIEKIKIWMPYADAVVLDQWEDTTLEQRAATGLDRLGISYYRTRDKRRVTFVAKGELTDVDLQNLQEFTLAFYRDFGSGYVHFTVELKDELLKDKSFKYGPNGYVKVAPKHWFFPDGKF